LGTWGLRPGWIRRCALSATFGVALVATAWTFAVAWSASVRPNLVEVPAAATRIANAAADGRQPQKLPPAGSVLVVNQRSVANSRYHIAVYRGGRLDSAFRLPADSCEQVWPTAFRVRGMVWLYAAERDCPGQWNRVVLYQGRTLLALRRVATVATDRALHIPTLAYDGRRFLLWYTRDVGRRWASELVYASARDGVHFGAAAVKDKGQGWYVSGFSPHYAFRHLGRWHLYMDGYAPALVTAMPGLYLFASPEQRSYGAMRQMHAENSQAPKLAPSFICKDGRGWRGVFTAWGAAKDRFGFEWTLTYAGESPFGPWRYQSEFIPLGPMLSLENPAPVLTGPEPVSCARQLQE
jgi:hypothetical protein